MKLSGKNVLVLGMGETGFSMTRWLLRAGANVRVADTRAAPPCLDAVRRVLPPAALWIGPFTSAAFRGVDLLAISPGVPLADPLVRQAVKEGIPVVGDIELFAHAVREGGSSKPKILAITGSNGKTTVTAMVGAMVKKAGWDVEIAGNIGPPVLDALMQRQDAGMLARAWVLEVSSFQLETAESLEPDAAAVLNLSEDHFDRYEGMRDYAEAKARIFLCTAKEDSKGNGGSNGRAQILNRDDPLVRAMALAGRRQVTFGLDLPVCDSDFGLLHEGENIWLMQGSRRLMKASELAIAGLHNCANVLAALALCRAIGLPFEPLLQASREFRGLPHRMEKVADFGGITFYDDSKGTNVGATVAALRGMRQRVVLIAGGDGKGQDFSPLAAALTERVRATVLIGRDAEKIAYAIGRSDFPLHRARTMKEAVHKGFELARKGDAVLLSPACASFDMFRNYEHRAEVFVAAVREVQASVARNSTKIDNMVSS